MPINKIKSITIIVLSIIFISNISLANETLKSIGKFKDWETFTMLENENKVCFAQSIPVLQAPKNNPRASRLFVTFRKDEKIQDEVSVTAGYIFNEKNKIKAKSEKILIYFQQFKKILHGFNKTKLKRNL